MGLSFSAGLFLVIEHELLVRSRGAHSAAGCSVLNLRTTGLAGWLAACCWTDGRFLDFSVTQGNLEP